MLLLKKLAMKSRILTLSLLYLAFVVQSVSAGAQGMSLSIEQCREYSVQNNVSVRNSYLDLSAAKAQKGEALAEFFPKVSINAFGFYSLNPMLEIGIGDILGDSDLSRNIQNIINEYAMYYGLNTTYSALKNGFSSSVMVMQPVYAGGRIIAGNRLADMGIEAAELKRDMTLREKLQETEENYWQVVALEEKLSTLNIAGRMLDTLQKDVRSAVLSGLATETDLLQVRLKKNELESGRIQLKNGIRLAKMNLLNGLGLDYCIMEKLETEGRPFIDNVKLTDRLDDPAEPMSYYVPEEEMAAAMEENRLLEISVEAKREEKRMALGEALPQVMIGASYGYSQLLYRTMNLNVFAMVSIPLSDWGKVSRKVQRYDDELQKAMNDRDYLSSQLLLSVRQLWLDVTSAWEQLLVARESMDLAQMTADQMMANYKAGMSTLSETLQAETVLQQSNETYLDKCIEYRNALSRYLGRMKTQD